MAKAKKKSSATRKRTATSRSQSVRRMRSNEAAQRLGRVVVPLFISLCLLGGIGFIAAMGYRTATASDFFGVRTVEIRGTDRSPVEDIRRIVTTNTEKSGVWNADLPAIREQLSLLCFLL